MSLKNTSNSTSFLRKDCSRFTFDFGDVPVEQYAKSLDVLFHDTPFREMVARRNRFVEAARRTRPDSSEMNALYKNVKQVDAKIADFILGELVYANIYSGENLETFSFRNLLKFYVDYSKEGAQGSVKELTQNLFKLTFMADTIDSVLVDIRMNMRDLFGESIGFEQFNTVMQVLSQLRTYLNSVISKDREDKRKELFFEYADSINDYLNKRMKTYAEKVKKLEEPIKPHTDTDVLNALDKIYGTTNRFNSHFIKHTESGGAYVDAQMLSREMKCDLTTKLLKGIDKVLPSGELNFNFNITDRILKIADKA